ncbi:MAG: 50S ribosomal protein L18 [Candidatus Dojkabacteria bacterium]|nr:50S ribosomal protein L18 [Candidatus Dojkabacteria bacterium]
MNRRSKRQKRIRKKIRGTEVKPRVNVFRSNYHIYVQVIDDVRRKTLASESDLKAGKGKKTEKAMAVGEKLGEKLKKLGVKEVCFDRGGYRYHGRVKALAEGLRKSTVKF